MATPTASTTRPTPPCGSSTPSPGTSITPETVKRHLLTPVGLRTLSPDHPDYKAKYDGDLRARDGAYHQGTVWPWLLGPFVDAWLKTFPERAAEARAMVGRLHEQLGQAGIGSVSEIFDAEEPFTPRGCIAQAWSVAELIRATALIGAGAQDGTDVRRDEGSWRRSSGDVPPQTPIS